MLTPPTLRHLAAAHDEERYTQAAHAQRIAQATAPGRPDHTSASVLTSLASASLAVQAGIVLLLIDRRVHAAAVTLALVASVLLGGDRALAGANLGSCRMIIGGRC